MTARSALPRAAGALYDAECAFHAARQTGVEGWMRAAADRLHEALLQLRAVEDAVASEAERQMK